MPPYSQGQPPTNTNTHYGSSNEHHRHKVHSQWGHTSSSGYPHFQWHHHNHGPIDQNNYDNRPHHHYHHHHHYPHGPIYDPNKNTESQQPAPPNGHSFPQRPGDQESETGSWHSNHGYQHEHHHYHHNNKGIPEAVPSFPWHGEESGQQTQQPPFDQTEDHKTSDGRFDYSPNRGHVNVNQGQEFTPNRQEYGRSGPEFPQSGSDQTVIPNVYADGNSQSSVDDNSRFNVQTVENRTSWRPVPTGNRFNLSSWSQYGPGQMPNQNQNRRWDQGDF